MSVKSFRSKSSFGVLLLTLAAFIWGTAFVAQSMGMDRLGPFAFNAARSLIGGTVLLPAALFSLRRGRKRGEALKTDWKKLLTGGALCGVMLGVASLFQQTGIKTTSAGKAGFLTALYIVLVPLLGCFFGRRPGWKAWLAAVIALCGIWLLSAGAGFTFAVGDLLLIACALFFSFHIIIVDHFSPYVSGVALSCVQFYVAGAISLAVALIWEPGTRWEDILSSWGPLLYTGVLSSGVAYTFQILGQKTVRTTTASLLMSLESVFAALAGWVVLKQPLSSRELIGCCLVFGAVVLAQLPEKKKETGESFP